MIARTNSVEETPETAETPERAAESISDALDFLRDEADAVGLSEVSGLIQEASTRSRGHSVAPTSAAASPTERVVISRRRYLPLAAVAGVAAIATALLLLPVQKYEATYLTAVGQNEEILLPDGSVIALNTDSELTVSYSKAERRVHLASGEAHFDIATAPERPFIVVAGSGTVRAVGTAFNVYLNDDIVEVMVTEGVVEVLPDRQQVAAGPPKTLGQGQKLEYGETIRSVSTVDTSDIARKLAWQDGMLDFQGETLAEVIREAGRYTSTRITVADPRAESLTVVGRVRAGDVEGLLEFIGSNKPVAINWVAPHHVQILATKALSSQ